MKFRPHQYQSDAIRFMLKRKAAGLFADPGMGKTAVALDIIRILQARALVIAPLRVCFTTWPNERWKWQQFNPLTHTILHGKNKTLELPQARIELMNPEGVFWLAEQEIEGRWDILIVDESTKFKNWTAKRTKLLRKMLKYFPRRYILTGTPTPNSLMDLFSQIYILDGGRALGKYITHYRRNYFNEVGYIKFRKYELRNGAETEIYDKIKPRAFRLDSKDYLNLPPLVYNNIPVVLDSDSQEIYDGMERELATELQYATILAGSAAVAYGKCRQIASGGLYDENKECHQIHKAKIEALTDLLEELHGKPVLVGYNFKFELEMLQKAFGRRLEHIDGKTTAKRSTAILDRWNARKIEILACQAGTVSHGVNLQDGGNDLVWYSPTDNPETYEQFNQRVYRQGIKGTVRIHHLIVKGTVEELILERLGNKAARQERLLDALKRKVGQK